MAIYTIGGEDVGTEIRQALGDDVSPYAYSDTVINNAIAQAVRWYNEMRPYMKSGSFTTVKDQQLYQLPSDCINVTELHYKRTDTDTIYERLAEFWPFHITDLDSESLTIVQRQLLRYFEEYTHFYWLQITSLTSYKTGRYVMLYPPPDTTGDTVNFNYTRKHTLSGSDYPTIPWEDADQFFKLVILAMDQRELSRYKRAPARYREGQTEQDYRATIVQLRQDIDDGLQAVRDALMSNVVVQG